MVKSDAEELVLDSEQFLYYKNYNKESGICHLKNPTDFLFEVVKLHINVFYLHFKRISHEQKLKEKLMIFCIIATNETDKFNLWFDKEHN